MVASSKLVNNKDKVPHDYVSFFLEEHLSGEENKDLGELLSPSSRANSSQKSDKSAGVRRICCLPS